MTSSKGNSYLNHYDGPLNPRSYTLQGAVGHTYLKPNQNEKHSNQYKECPFTPCKYWSPNATSCNVPINCGSAPEHLRLVHDVRDISRTDQVICAWTEYGQSVLRNNFVRHVREKHLGHPRNPADPKSPSKVENNVCSTLAKRPCEKIELGMWVGFDEMEICGPFAFDPLFRALITASQYADPFVDVSRLLK
ncbi:hypothetical protein F5141DRAFT_1292300 [Pisolithus sp. B1]|nr:hypothetical protein F5141DRAFT_1292300 [Pisolithus sp. B1]